MLAHAEAEDRRLSAGPTRPSPSARVQPNFAMKPGDSGARGSFQSSGLLNNGDAKMPNGEFWRFGAFSPDTPAVGSKQRRSAAWCQISTPFDLVIQFPLPVAIPTMDGRRRKNDKVSA